MNFVGLSRQPQPENKGETVPNPLVSAMTVPLRAYQKYISPGLPRRCRYYPTCSSYFIEALKVHGALKGGALGVWRVLRCNPWSRGGVDHVPEPGRWKPDPWEPPEDWVGHDIEAKPTIRETVTSWFRGEAGASLRVEQVSFSDGSLGRRSETGGSSVSYKES